MMLRRRVIVTSLAIALPVAALLAFMVDRVRARDMERDLERVVRGHINAQVRERCESDPGWFLTGPLIGRPPGGIFVDPNPDALPPRPKIDPQPFELFAYDETFAGSSSASPRMPPEFRNPLRSDGIAVAPFDTTGGRGAQVAMATGWTGSICSYFVGRLQPPPNQWRQRLLITVAIFIGAVFVALVAASETVRRVRRLAHDVHQAVDAGYTAIGPDKLRDELSSLTFVYNDAAKVLQERKTRIEDQDVALRRLVQSMAEEVTKPLAAIEHDLAAIGAGQPVDPARLVPVFASAHELSARGENLSAVARLKLSAPLAAAPVDLNALVARVVARHAPVARIAGVTLGSSAARERIVVTGDEALIERAVSNLVDNAIKYNASGGQVTIGLATAEGGSRFRLWVTDTGRGVTDEEFKGLTAIRRFRGDEGRNRRPGTPGLSLAVTREVSDRFGLQLDLRRPGAGGFEAEISGPQGASAS